MSAHNKIQVHYYVRLSSQKTLNSVEIPQPLSKFMIIGVTDSNLHVFGVRAL